MRSMHSIILSFLLPLLFILSFCHPPLEERVHNDAGLQPSPTNQTIPPVEQYLPVVQTPSHGSCVNAPLDAQVIAREIEAVSVLQHYFVTTDGDDQLGDGTISAPWASISHAVKQVNDGSTIWVYPGLYEGQVALTGTFQKGIEIRACDSYKSQLRHNSAQVVTCFTCQGITLEGFDIAHSGPGAFTYVVQIQDLLGKRTGGLAHVSRVILRNNVIHDSYNNDLVKLNNGARQVLIEGNMFYNQQGLESHVDINGVTDVIVQNNVFFNDFAGSERKNRNDTGGYIVIKDSNGSADDILGASNIFVRRNLFFNWEGEPSGNSFVAIGEDAVSHYQAFDVLIENNLMLGNSQNLMRAAMQIRGSRDITIRNNTISGDLPSSAYAIRMSRQSSNQPNKNVRLFNNIWSDPTGTMGSEDPNDWRDSDFSDARPDDTDSFDLSNNLYWNGGQTIYQDNTELVNLSDDPTAIVADPRIPVLSGKAAPRWLPKRGYFADGSLTINEVFRHMITKYGMPHAKAGILQNADPSNSPSEDIFGLPRNHVAPTFGAVEQVPLLNK